MEADHGLSGRGGHAEQQVGEGSIEKTSTVDVGWWNSLSKTRCLEVWRVIDCRFLLQDTSCSSTLISLIMHRTSKRLEEMALSMSNKVLRACEFAQECGFYPNSSSARTGTCPMRGDNFPGKPSDVFRVVL